MKDGLEEEQKLKKVSSNLKKNVAEIRKKLHQQDLLLESIAAHTNENILGISGNKNRLYDAIKAMKKDGRNYIILIFTVLVFMLGIYLFS